MDPVPPSLQFADSGPRPPPPPSAAPPAGLLSSNRGSDVATEDETIPTVHESRFPQFLFDARANIVRGYLYKKGGTRGPSMLGINRRNWNKRLFVIECGIRDDRNYTIKYFKDGDKSPKGELNLEGTWVVAEDRAHSNADVGYEFQIEGARQNVFEMYAMTERERDMWMTTLRYIISVADQRGQFQARKGLRVQRADNFQSSVRNLSGRDLDSGSTGSAGSSSRGKKNKSRGLKKAIASPREALPAVSVFEASVPEAKAADSGVIQTLRQDNLALRIDADLDAMPMGSADQATFVQRFSEDVARTCSLLPEEVQVVGLRHAPNLDWMTIVEFRFKLDPSFPRIGSEIRRALGDALLDQDSILFHGHVTCNVDPTFTAGVAPDCGQEMNQLAFMRSPVPAVQRVLDKYSTQQVPAGVVDLSHFRITLVWDSLERDMWVLNPRLLARAACAVWPQDVMRALGLTGSLHERWLRPLCLEPLGLPESLSASIVFLPSVRTGGLPTIDAWLLKANLRYNVVFEDLRMDSIAQLSEEQKAEIQERFDKFDTNADGSVSQQEAVAYAKQRTQDSLAQVEQQYQDFLADTVDPEEQAKAAEQRERHLVNIHEAESKLLKMFEKADVNGDGQLSFQEFILAEAWWMNSTMNPQKLNLF